MSLGINCYHYEGGPHHRILKPQPVTQPELIACPGGCGGQAVLEPAMTVTRGGVTTEVIPATCKGTCTMEVTRGFRRPVTVTVPRRFELDPKNYQAKDHQMIKDQERKDRKKQQDRLLNCMAAASKTQAQLAEELGISLSTVSRFLSKKFADGELRLRQNYLDTMMAWCERVEQRANSAALLENHRTGDNIPPTPEVAIAPTPKPAAIPHEIPQDTPERKTRPIETGNAYRAFLEPFLVSAVRDKLATIDPDLADAVEVRVLLEMPS